MRTGSRPRMSSTCDLAHLADDVPAGLQQLEDRRQRAHRDAALAAGAHDARAQRARRRRDRDRDLVGLGLVEDPRQVGVVPSTRTPSIRMPPLERVVVDEADRVRPQLRVAQDLAQHEAAAVAGADDQHAARASRRARKPRQRALVDQRARAKRAPPTKHAA